MRVTRDFLRGRGREAMSEADKDILERAVDRIDILPPRTIVTRRGDRLRTHHARPAGTRFPQRLGEKTVRD